MQRIGDEYGLGRTKRCTHVFVTVDRVFPTSHGQSEGNLTLTHWTAHLTHEGGALSLQCVLHPIPGPNEILIEVKAIAFSHIDYKQRDGGLNSTRYPTVLGSDVEGLVKQVGPVVQNRQQAAPLAIGTRALAFASASHKDGDPVYGAFQELVLVSVDRVVPIPHNMIFEEGASVPLSVLTAFTAWTAVGPDPLPPGCQQQPDCIRVGLLVQQGRNLECHVYATASPTHHEFLRSLGANAVFDYNDPDVVDQIQKAARRDKPPIPWAHCLHEEGLGPVLAILQHSRPVNVTAKCRVAHVPALPSNYPTSERVKVRPASLPQDAADRDWHMHPCFQRYLKPSLEESLLVPSLRLKSAEYWTELLEGMSVDQWRVIARTTLWLPTVRWIDWRAVSAAGSSL